ncbi:Protein FAR-RED IMPAIRED RESPONSE 1 [Bienertia sinuspersici]
MDKGVVEVEVDLMRRGVRGGFCEKGRSGVDADVVGDVRCRPTKECIDVVALAPPTGAMGFGVVKVAWSGYKAEDNTRQRRNAQWTYDRFSKPDWRRKMNGKRCAIDSHNEEVFIVAHHKEEINCHVKRKLKLGHSTGLKTAQIHNMLAREMNGLQDIAINERDIKNELYRKKKLKLKDGDTNAMLECFEKVTEGNQILIHTYLLDNVGQIQDILWVEARSRTAYEEFNDMVSITMVRESYMGTLHERGGILTNQEAAMCNALRPTMLETHHIWCIWHITDKFSHKLGKCKGYNEFKDELLNAIYDSLSVPEFGSSWMAIINKHGLEDNVWLDGNFETFIRKIACGIPCEFVFQHYYTDMKFKESQCECSRIMFLHYFQNAVTSDNVTEYTFEE